MALISILCFLTACSRQQDEYEKGQGFAAHDIAKGQLNVALPDGTNMPAFPQYSDLLQKRYQINIIWFSLPADPQAAEAWVRGYNEVSGPEIGRKYGTNVLQQTMTDAEKLHALAREKKIH